MSIIERAIHKLHSTFVIFIFKRCAKLFKILFARFGIAEYYIKMRPARPLLIKTSSMA